MAEVTKSEQQARAMAERLEGAGFTVKVTIDHAPEELYDFDGSVMIPARVSAHVYATGPRYFDNSYGFTIVSWLPARGHRATTRYAGGTLYRGTHIKGRKGSRKLGLRELRNRIAGEVDSARYAHARRDAAQASR